MRALLIGLVVVASCAPPADRDDGSRAGTARAQAKALLAAVEQYRTNNGELPAGLDDLTRPQPSGGEPFFDADKLLDPWKKRFQYDPKGPRVWTVSPRGDRLD